MVRRFNFRFALAVLALIAGAMTVRATTASSETTSVCQGDLDYIGDSVCDDTLNNNEECEFDGGDCCECTCVDLDKESSCIEFTCRDTTAECYVAPSPTPAPVAEAETEDSGSASTTAWSSTLLAAVSAACVVALGSPSW